MTADHTLQIVNGSSVTDTGNAGNTNQRPATRSFRSAHAAFAFCDPRSLSGTLCDVSGSRPPGRDAPGPLGGVSAWGIRAWGDEM